MATFLSLFGRARVDYLRDGWGKRWQPVVTVLDLIVVLHPRSCARRGLGNKSPKHPGGYKTDGIGMHFSVVLRFAFVSRSS